MLWDIPCSVFIPSMKDNVMLAHHLGMALVAGAVSTTGTGSYYALFFFGVIEISSIPLTLVDIFHPKRFPQLAKKYAILGTANEVCTKSCKGFRRSFGALIPISSSRRDRGDPRFQK